ncbi:MAG: hypothetical protein ACRDL7_00835, partial [Gaiellaceae bacterium]
TMWYDLRKLPSLLSEWFADETMTMTTTTTGSFSKNNGVVMPSSILSSQQRPLAKLHFQSWLSIIILLVIFQFFHAIASPFKNKNRNGSKSSSLSSQGFIIPGEYSTYMTISLIIYVWLLSVTILTILPHFIATSSESSPSQHCNYDRNLMIASSLFFPIVVACMVTLVIGRGMIRTMYTLLIRGDDFISHGNAIVMKRRAKKWTSSKSSTNSGKSSIKQRVGERLVSDSAINNKDFNNVDDGGEQEKMDLGVDDRKDCDNVSKITWGSASPKREEVHNLLEATIQYFRTATIRGMRYTNNHNTHNLIAFYRPMRELVTMSVQISIALCFLHAHCWSTDESMFIVQRGKHSSPVICRTIFSWFAQELLPRRSHTSCGTNADNVSANVTDEMKTMGAEEVAILYLWAICIFYMLYSYGKDEFMGKHRSDLDSAFTRRGLLRKGQNAPILSSFFSNNPITKNETEETSDDDNDCDDDDSGIGYDNVNFKDSGNDISYSDDDVCYRLRSLKSDPDLEERSLYFAF